jgi:UDP-N-acetylmuramoylalanine--D-glutamate ligase
VVGGGASGDVGYEERSSQQCFINMTNVQGKRVTVAGLGRFGGGIAVSRWLVEQGAAKVLVSDQASAEQLSDSIKQLDGLPIEFHFGVRQNIEDFTQADLIVASPAIAPTNSLLLAAKDARVPVTTEIVLFIERCSATIIGVTGTKGKSTTTEILGRMLTTRYRTWVGGNIGKSLLLDLGRIDKKDLVVLELSSFMLEYLGGMQWSPHVAVVTMISSDHLDWHGSADAYISAKRNIVRFQRPDDFAVLNDSDAARSFSLNTVATVVNFSLDRGKHFDLALAGIHNQLNAQGAFAAANILGVTWDQAQGAIRDFRGLPHRLEVVHERDGIRFVNDSIATIPEAAIAALDSFPVKRVIQIVGGSMKKDPPIVDFCAALNERAKGVLCIGETGPKIAAALAESFSPANTAVYTCGDLVTAMNIANSIAIHGDVVLLSPGYASYDQFVNFEQRGETFARLAKG